MPSRVIINPAPVIETAAGEVVLDVDFVEGLAPVAQEIVAGEILEQVYRIDDRHHRVRPGRIGQRRAFLVAELEGGGHRPPAARASPRPAPP